MDFTNFNINPRYKDKDSWPHRFIKRSEPFQGGNGKLWQLFSCMFCDKEWVGGRDAKPVGVCPARNDRSELKKLGVL